MPDPADSPLIYTSLGNMPAADLQYAHQWIDNEGETTFIEEHSYLGKVVKRSVHTMLKKPAVESVAEAASLT